MLVVMRAEATKEEVNNVISYLQSLQLKAEELPGSNRVAIGVTGNKKHVAHKEVQRMPGVKELIEVTHKYKKVSREFYPKDTVVNVGAAAFGGEKPVLIAGPCSVESADQIMRTAEMIKNQGAQVLRGGIFKPRTSPYDFQGLGYKGLELLKKASIEFDLPICVELMNTEDISLYSHEVDLIQIGARNMQNFDLLKKLGKIDTPILLKRGASATVEEFLLAAEYILDGGNPNVILCERGIRTFETSTRNTLDLNSVALIRQMSHLPIIVDPCHAAGRHDLVTPLALASMAVGAQGLIIETHPEPFRALSDANQQLDFDQFANFYAAYQNICALNEMVYV
jgi:3-deoxy-7-phosphoheptulonate synthase